MKDAMVTLPCIEHREQWKQRGLLSKSAQRMWAVRRKDREVRRVGSGAVRSIEGRAASH